MRKTYDEVEKWISENPEFVKKIKEDNSWSLRDYQDIIHWYEDIKEYKEILLGDKILSIEDIKNKFFESLPEEENFDFSEHPMYDEDGYCSRAMYQEIKYTWEDLSKKDLIMILSGDYDETDFDGGRSRFLSGMAKYFFNYIFYTLGWAKDDLENKIYNSTSFNDDVSFYFPPDISLLTSAKREEKAKKVVKINDLKKERKVSEFLVKYPKEMEEDLKELKHLHFIGYSKNDDNPIYQIEMVLPENFELVYGLNKYLNDEN